MRQPPLPSHLPSVSQAAAPLSTHWLFGSTAAAGAFEQVPSLPARAQDWQAPWQLVSQHLPWAQSRSSARRSTGEAWGFFRQVPPRQRLGATQSESLEQVERQPLLAPQT